MLGSRTVLQYYLMQTLLLLGSNIFVGMAVQIAEEGVSPFTYVIVDKET